VQSGADLIGMLEVFERTGPQTCALILFIQTLALYKSFTYLLTYLLTYFGVGQFWTLKINSVQINLPIWTTLMFRLWRKHRY